ncbi:HWE histidine kinase domain-containing protein [Reyranella sp.]|uniref:HWE histidine kinase domain-containing protein n=1 Tax=Reyranella sp. TaxID=1929291 RepID=UPI003BAB58DF
MNSALPEQTDLTNCDREPIHLLGAIQPFGFLLAVSRAEWVVQRASANAADWLGAAGTSLIGQPLLSIFSPETVHLIRGHLQTAIMANTRARIFGVELRPRLTCDLAVHLVDDLVVIEGERSDDEPSFNAAATITGMMAGLAQADSDRVFYRMAARNMRALTGFDRVMIYRFDQDGSGEVIAESANAGLESYLGLHYPASDIPRQARALYERNWLRIIPDINAETSPVEPTLDAEGRPIDLSMSILRSVSTIHIEYLRNMGVQASMSVSILRQGRLWGLFACHHYATHHVGFARRTASELFGQMFSLMMESRERESESAYEARAQRLHQRLIAAMASEASRFESIVAQLDGIADLLTCDGVGLWTDGQATLKDRTPSAPQFAELVAHLDTKDITEVYAQHDIGAEFEPARAYADRAAGMLVVPLSRPARDYLVFFREEAARYVNWAGDPAKPVKVGPLGDRLTPRKSFELWKQAVRGQSLPWKPVEVRIAENLRVSLLEVILSLTSQTAIERKRAQERQELLIAELNHRVRNILGLIRGVLSQSRDTTDNVEAFTKVVGGRVQALARAHDQVTAEHWGPARFKALVMAEAGAYLGQNASRVEVEGPDALIEPQAFTTVALIMHEMVTNSAKYGALSDNRGRVGIATHFDAAGRYWIVWREEGGPPVKPPTRHGFGSVVIERSMVHDLQGEARVEFAPAGVQAEFVVPASFVSVPKEAPAGERPTRAEVARPPHAVPADVLVVEDNMIIALDTEGMIRGLGVASVRVASSRMAALSLVQERRPDFAFLDVNLGAETSFEVAEELLRRGVPFAFTSGYGEQAAFPPEMSGIPRVTKPYTSESLREHLAAGDRDPLHQPAG